MTIDIEKLRALHAKTGGVGIKSVDRCRAQREVIDAVPALLTEINGLRALNNSYDKQNKRLLDDIDELREENKRLQWLLDGNAPYVRKT